MTYASWHDNQVATCCRMVRTRSSPPSARCIPPRPCSSRPPRSCRHQRDSIATSSEPRCAPGVPSTLHRAEPMEEARRCPALIANVKGPPRRPTFAGLGHGERRGEQGSASRGWHSYLWYAVSATCEQSGFSRHCLFSILRCVTGTWNPDLRAGAPGNTGADANEVPSRHSAQTSLGWWISLLLRHEMLSTCCTRTVLPGQLSEVHADQQLNLACTERHRKPRRCCIFSCVWFAVSLLVRVSYRALG